MTKGEGGVWTGPKKDDVIYEQPLKRIQQIRMCSAVCWLAVINNLQGQGQKLTRMLEDINEGGMWTQNSSKHLNKSPLGHLLHHRHTQCH